MTINNLFKRIALVEARVNADVEARGPNLLSPLARSQLKDWRATHTLEQQYEAMLDCTHPLSPLTKSDGIPRDASDVEAADYYSNQVELTKVRKWNTTSKH